MRDAEKLAAYRVDRGEGGFRAVPMTEQEVKNRNVFIRLKLGINPAWELSDVQMEQVRIYRMGKLWVIEDECLMVFVLGEEGPDIPSVKKADPRIPAELARDGYNYCGNFGGN